MLTVRDSIDALLPTLESVMLVDKNLNGYDGWDNIVESLFNAIVEDSITSSLSPTDAESFSMTGYDFINNGKDSYIFTTLDNLGSDKLLFKCFARSSESSSLDLAKLYSLDDPKRELLVSLHKIEFQCFVRLGIHEKIVNQLRVEL